MLIVVSKVMSIFIIMLVGFVAYKLGALKDDAIRPMTALMMNITTPCLIVSSLYSKELSGGMLSDSLAVMAGVLLFYIFGTLLTYALLKLFKIGDKEDIGVYIASVVATNSGFMGFPIVKALYGSDMLYLMVMGNMMLNVYLVSIEPSTLTIGTGQKGSAKDLLNALKTPIVISLLIGFAMVFMHIKPTGLLDETITMIGDVTVPLSMILVGIRLGSIKIGEVITESNVLVSIFSMIIMPLLTLALVYPMGFISNEVKIILVMTVALPTAVVAVVIAEQYKKNSLLLSEMVSLTTLMSIATIPATAIILETLLR